MRVLFVNKFWYRRGGQERVVFDEIAWLEAAGHEIAHFSTLHPRNEPSPWSTHFVPSLEWSEQAGLSFTKKAAAAARMFHNAEAARRFSSLLREFRPDVVHVHGIHRQLSPSVLDVARSSKVPVVHSLHDCHLVCPNDILMYRGERICDPRRCGTLWFGPCVRGRCVRKSLPTSVVFAAETAWARARQAYRRGVTRFVCPSRFMREQMAAAKWRVPIDVIPNALVAEPPRADAGVGFAIIGRVSYEKGIEVALKAARLAQVELTIAGDGPLRAALQAQYPGSTFTGHLGSEALADLVRRSRAIVVPSLCFENAPMSVLEAMAAGVPVIASRLGGIPEQVEHEADGLLVAPGDVLQLADAMRSLEDDALLARRLGAHARQTLIHRFSPDAHVDALEKTYRACIGP